jgi:hypothetical protein
LWIAETGALKKANPRGPQSSFRNQHTDHPEMPTTDSMPNININCWNEWTEGSYLEPDEVHGMKYLEAVRDVFGVSGKNRL